MATSIPPRDATSIRSPERTPPAAMSQSSCRSRTHAPVRPGTVLVREWAGGVCHVMALEDGFAWNGTTYRSLSQVARAITGTRWNGRRFFGVPAANGPTSPGVRS